MRPLRKYPNGGDIKDGGELPQINLTASRANWEKQKELRKQLAQTQEEYNKLIREYGLTADDQNLFGFNPYQGGTSSVEELQAKINKLNESYKNVNDQFASANRALADLRMAYPDEWNNKTVSDVISDSGLRAMQRLKREEKINDFQFRDFYRNYGAFTDPNMKFGYGLNPTYSATKAKENWMEDVPDFVSKVNKLAMAAPLLGGGAAVLPEVMTLAANTIPPYLTAPLTIGNKVFPYINPINTIGLGFGAHSAANLADPNSASRQSISRAYQNPTTENILNATGNVSMDVLGVLTSPGMGNMLLKAGKGIANTPRAIGNFYEDVATGGYSAIPYAWKNPAAALDAEQSTAMFNKIMQADNFTDAEKALLKEYQYDNSAFITPGPKQDAFNALIKKAEVTFPKNTVVTRAFSSNPSELEGFTGTADDIKTISMQDRPSAFSAGVSGKDKLYYDNQNRIVLAGRNLKKVEGNFVKQNYNPVKEGYYAGIPKENLTINYRGPKTNNYGNAFNHKVGDHYYGTSRMTPEEINAEAEAIYNNRVTEFNDPTKTKYFTPSTVEELVNTGNYTPKEAEELVAYQTKVFNEQKALYGDSANKDKALQKIIDDSKGFSQKEGPKEELELFGSGFDMKVVGKFPNKHGGFDYVVQPKNIKSIYPKQPPGSSSAASYKVTPYSTTNSSIEDVSEKLKKSRDFIKIEGEKELADFASEEGLRRARLAFKKTNPKLTDDEIDSLVADQMTELQNAINYNIPEYALQNPDIWKNFNTDATSKSWLEGNFPNYNAFAWDNPNFYQEMTNLEGMPTYSNPNLINMDISELGNFKGLPSSVQKSLLQNQLKFTRPYFKIPTVSIGPKHIGDVPTMAHEVGHLLQRGAIHPTDLELQKLVNKEGITPSGLIQKTWNQLFRLSPEYYNSFKYFYAPKGRFIPDEGYAFARETRQAMLDKGIIKDKFENITPSKILQYRLSQPFSMRGGQRLTTIVPPWKWKSLSKIMNDMNVVIPGAVGTGAVGYGLSNSQNNNRTYKSGGSLAPNLPTYYNFRGTPIYRDTTALPFASGGMLDGFLDGGPDDPVLSNLKNLNTNEISALLYNTVANIIERKKAEGKIKPGENLDLRGVVAQILLESGNAKSGLTAKYNNFGGLRATQGFIDRGGKTVSMVNKATGKKFLWRAYDTPEQGLEAQIDFLLNNPRYRKAGVFNAKNTQEYLAAVSKAGYAGGEPSYARKVNQMAKSLDKRLKKVTPEKLQELNQTYNVSPTLQPIGVNTAAPINQAAVTPQVQVPVTDPAILAMRENLVMPTKSTSDILRQPITNIEEIYDTVPELNPPSFVPDEGYYMSGLPTPKFKSRVVPFMGKGASNYQTSGGLRLPYVSGWNQNQFINPVAARVQQQTDYDPDYYYGTDEEPGEYEKASLENRPINFEGGFASKKMQRDAERYLQEYDQYNQFLQDSENYGNLMLGRQFKYGSNLYERQGLIPSMYASSLGRYYRNGGKIDYSMYDVFQHGTYANGGMIKRADGSYSQRGLWDNIRANAGSGKKPTKEMLTQERKINNQKANGGYLSSFKASNIQTY